MKRYIIHRHHKSGVWVGEVLGRGVLDPAGALLLRARKIWSWSGGRLETSQIATRGLDPAATHKLGDVVEVEIPFRDLVDTAFTTREVVEQIHALPSYGDDQ